LIDCVIFSAEVFLWFESTADTSCTVASAADVADGSD